jgi:hypothetical protein
MSSSGWKSLFAQEGIFGSDINTNPFAQFNMAFIKYCSSDGWFGDAAASSSTFGFSFRGSRIVSATLQALVTRHGLGSSGEQENLLFGGCSAGGRGVLTNLDAFAAAAPANVRVRGLLDAAAWVDVQPIIPNMLSLQMMTEDMYNFVQAPIPGDCAAQYAGSEWRCLWPSYRLPYVTTPYFLNAAQFDAFQIMYDTNNLDSTYCCNTPQQQQWADQFQSQTLALLSAVPPTNGIYSSSCLVHCLSCNSDWYTFTVDGQSLAHTVALWYFSGAKSDDISQCNGWDCTLQCSGGPWEPTNTPCPTTTNQCANEYMAPPAGGVSAQQAAVAGNQAWASTQVTANKQAAAAGGQAAWNAQQQEAHEQGVDPYKASGVPEAVAQQQGNQAWAQQQAAANAAAAKAAGAAAWQAQQQAALHGVVAPPAPEGAVAFSQQQQQQQQQGGPNGGQVQQQQQQQQQPQQQQQQQQPQQQPQQNQQQQQQQPQNQQQQQQQQNQQQQVQQPQQQAQRLQFSQDFLSPATLRAREGLFG